MELRMSEMSEINKRVSGFRTLVHCGVMESAGQKGEVSPVTMV